MQSKTRYDCYYRRDVQEIRLDGLKMAISIKISLETWGLSTSFSKKFLAQGALSLSLFFCRQVAQKRCVVVGTFFLFFLHFNESESLSGTDFTGAQLRRSSDFPLLFGYVIFKHVCGRFRQIGSHYFSSLSRHLIDQQRRNWIRAFSEIEIWGLYFSFLWIEVKLQVAMLDLGSSGLTTWRFQLLLLCLQRGKVEWELDRERELESLGILEGNRESGGLLSFV